MLNDVKRIIKKYKLNIDINPTIIQSLTHSSYANEHDCSDNERLEFLGDSILGFLVAEYLYNYCKRNGYIYFYHLLRH